MLDIVPRGCKHIKHTLSFQHSQAFVSPGCVLWHLAHSWSYSVSPGCVLFHRGVKFLIHGVIDGYSRLFVSLRLATNNRAETVLRFFESATESFGVPLRVRGDYGSEIVRPRTSNSTNICPQWWDAQHWHLGGIGTGIVRNQWKHTMAVRRSINHILFFIFNMLFVIFFISQQSEQSTATT